jgi:hypothetical protein
MKKKIVITWVLVVSLFISAVPAWAAPANPLADAAYYARLAEDNNKSAANAIKKAVLDDKKGNPAQAAYDARIKENEKSKNPFDKKIAGNPADKIYQAVTKEQKKLSDDAARLAGKINSKEASEALNMISNVFYSFSPDSITKSALKKTEKLADVYQIAMIYRKLASSSNEYERANLSLDLIGKTGSLAFGPIRTQLLSSVVGGCKDVIAAHKYKMDDIELIWAGLDWYSTGGGGSEYRELALVLLKDGKSANTIDKTISALEFFKKMN